MKTIKSLTKQRVISSLLTAYAKRIYEIRRAEDDPSTQPKYLDHLPSCLRITIAGGFSTATHSL